MAAPAAADPIHAVRPPDLPKERKGSVHGGVTDRRVWSMPEKRSLFHGATYELVVTARCKALIESPKFLESPSMNEEICRHGPRQLDVLPLIQEQIDC